MLKLSVCIEMLFTNLPFTQRIEKAAKSGLSAFEFWSWSNKDIQAIVKEKDKYDLTVVTFAADSKESSVFSDWDKGFLVNPDNHKDFIIGFKESAKVAKELNCGRLTIVAGNTQLNLSREIQCKSIICNLKEAVKIAEDNGMTILLEPLNILVDHQGHFLSSSHEACRIIEEVNSPNVKLLYDIYHQQITEGNLISTIKENISFIGHFHIADVPGRHEPGTGEINYANIFKTIDNLPYEGYIGLEYIPLSSSERSIAEIIEKLTYRGLSKPPH